MKQARRSPGVLAHCIRDLIEPGDGDGVDGDAALAVLAELVVKGIAALSKR